MKVGDLIQWTGTGCHGMIVAIESGKAEFIHILCGPDADGDGGGETLAFPRETIEGYAEVINASR